MKRESRFQWPVGGRRHGVRRHAPRSRCLAPRARARVGASGKNLRCSRHTGGDTTRSCVSIQPCLEHQYGPHKLLPIALAADVLKPHFPNRFGMEKAVLPEARLGKKARPNPAAALAANHAEARRIRLSAARRTARGRICKVCAEAPAWTFHRKSSARRGSLHAYSYTR